MNFNILTECALSCEMLFSVFNSSGDWWCFWMGNLVSRRISSWSQCGRYVRPATTLNESIFVLFTHFLVIHFRSVNRLCVLSVIPIFRWPSPCAWPIPWTTSIRSCKMLKAMPCLIDNQSFRNQISSNTHPSKYENSFGIMPSTSMRIILFAFVQLKI